MIWKIQKNPANFEAKGYNNQMKILEKGLMENVAKPKKE